MAPKCIEGVDMRWPPKCFEGVDMRWPLSDSPVECVAVVGVDGHDA